MKKLLQLFSKQALLLCLILISSMSWGQTITYTGNFGSSVGGSSSYSPNKTITLESQNWLASYCYFASNDFRLGHNKTSGIVPSKFISSGPQGASIEMQWDIINVKSISIATTGEYGTPQNWYIFESTDAGVSWSQVASSSYTSSESWSYTASTPKPSARYALVQSGISSPRVKLGVITIVTEAVTQDPSLIASTEEISDLNYIFGAGPSVVQNFTLEGVNLDGTGNVLIGFENISSDFEMSLDGINFDSTLSLLEFTGSPSVIYVRLKSGKVAANYTDNINILSDYSGTNLNIAISGSVIAPPPVPVIQDDEIMGTLGVFLSYQILASASPDYFFVSSDALPPGLTLDETTGLISGTPSQVGSYLTGIKATNFSGDSAEGILIFEIAKANQTITFEELADQSYGVADFNLTATSSSGLPLTYTSSNTAVATVLGTTVTVIGMGTTDITASQAGDANYNPAADSVQSLNVTTKTLTITGLTANDKLQDGTTAATLSGTASLNGIVAGDETDVVLSGTPTATFASALPETGITVSVTGYTLAGAKASNYSLTQPELTATITALEIPVATPATTITTDSFTANWNAVPGATGYELDVYTVDAGAPATTITETFTAIGGGTSSSYNTRAWTGNGGIEWTAYKARTDQEIVDGNEAITLRDEAGAYLQSGVITGGLSNISFEVKQFFNGSGGVVTVKVLTGPTFAIVTTLGTKSYTTTASSYDSGFISGITGDFKILIESNASARAGIDNLSFTGLSTSTVTYVFQNQNVGNVTSYEVSGLNPNTHYFYVVRAVNGTASLNSNEIEVTTAAPAAITWNGTSWSNTTGPDATLDAVIDGNYNETANITAKNLTVAAGVVVTVAPTSVLTVSGDLVNNGTLVFESTAAGTASFAPYNGAPISGTGTATVERYIPAKRAWRFLTAPLQGTTNNELVANWQGTADEGMLLFAPATYQSQTMTGYAVGGIAPNIFKYNTGWQAIPDLTSENLFGATANDTQAYQIFVTGASNSTNIATGAAATTLRPKGTLITGTVNHNLTANAYKLLPNPYASPIDTEAMVANNAGAKVWLLDPSIGFGGYVTYDGLNWSAPTSGNDKYIQSGQGFFVKSTNTSFAIQEAFKVNGNSNTWFERASNTENATKIRVLLYKQDAADWQLADAILAVNSLNDNTAVDAADASKISNYNESLMFRNGTSNLAIEYRGVPQVNEIQPLRLTGTSATGYQLRIYVESFIENSLVPLLEDTLLGTFTSIPTDGSTVTIPFTGVVSNTTNPDDRFRMVYQTALSNDSFESLNVVVYPNPVSNGTLSVNLPQGEDAAFELYNVLGQKVQQGILAATNNSVNVSRLQSGVYVLNIEQSGKKFTTKVIVDAN